MKKKTTNEKTIIFSVLIILLLVFLSKFNTLSLINTSFPFEETRAIQGLDFAYKSTNQIGSYSTEVSTGGSCPSELKIKNTFGTSDISMIVEANKIYYEGGCRTGDGLPGISSVLFSRGLNLNKDTFNSLKFNYRPIIDASPSYCGDSAGTGAVIKIYLTDGNQDLLLRDIPQSESGGSHAVSLFKEFDNIILSIDGNRQVINIPEGSLDLLFYGQINSVANRDNGCHETASISISNLELDDTSSFITVYRKEDNKCFPVQILPEDKTPLDFDTLSECRESITNPPFNIYLMIGLALVGIAGVLFFLKRNKTRK